MPSVIAGIPEELDQLLDDMVERDEAEDRSDAAKRLMEYTAYNKYDIEV